jgi:hypothetical protein
LRIVCNDFYKNKQGRREFSTHTCPYDTIFNAYLLPPFAITVYLQILSISDKATPPKHPTT